MTQNDTEYTEGNSAPETPTAGLDPQLVRAGELMAQGDLEAARKLFQELAEAPETRAGALHGLGLVCLAAGDLNGALERLEEAVAEKPDSAAFLNNLAVAQTRGKLLYPAKNTLSRALELDRDHADSWANLGLIMLSLGDDFSEIDLILNRALKLRPGHPGALEHLAELRRRQNRHQERAIICKALAEGQTPRRAFFLRQAAESCLALSDFAAAEPLLAQAAKLDGQSADLARLHGDVLGALGRGAEAKTEFRRGASLNGGRELWRWAHLAFAPRCFTDAEALDDYRQWLSDELEEAAAEVPAFDPQLLGRDGFTLPFEMSFHGRLCREPREKFAALFAKSFAGFSRPEAKPVSGRPIRLGFVSVGGTESGFWRAMGPAVARLDPKRFESVIFIGPAGRGFQAPPAQLMPGRPVVLPPDFSAAAETLRRAECDVMYYWRAGDDPWSLFLPMTRPAPVQCVSWGAHGTTGLSDIDYYLSWDAAEAPGAEAHYSEHLVRLNAPPIMEPEGPKSRWVDRRSLGLPARGTFYFAPHRPAMYQPLFDDLLAGILGGDPRGFAALILDPRWPGAVELRRRLRRRVGEDAFRRIFFMPAQSAESYLRYMTAADLVLESPVHSGEVGSLDALGRGVVCVTLEGGLMVRRQTAARYREMGLEELIAADEKAYVDITLRLAREPEYRHGLAKKLLEKKRLLVNRADTVIALASFFESVTGGGRTSIN